MSALRQLDALLLQARWAHIFLRRLDDWEAVEAQAAHDVVVWADDIEVSLHAAEANGSLHHRSTLNGSGVGYLA